MTLDELLAMLRHAAENHGAHHIAAINEIRELVRIGISDESFRDLTIEILDAVMQVDDEVDAATEAGGR